ncbi:hypothetical protein FHS16_000005 [Paenibacillus endophyticus]|uniref:Uncharacterized protein n=1 Tax=Paenibacillus endophyticus TaxID=1294268 RepID=A0A7W5C2G0_9BACL|nr:hypothetical protein [Paenibacillus endophyticus]
MVLLAYSTIKIVEHRRGQLLNAHSRKGNLWDNLYAAELRCNAPSEQLQER